MEPINIDKYVENDIFWSELFNIINRSFDILYFTYKDKHYFNCSNQWYDGKDIIKQMKELNIKPSHRDCNCDGYFECDNPSKYCKKKVEPYEITYTFSGYFKLDEDKEDEEYKGEDLKNWKNIKNFFQKITNLGLKPEEIKFCTKERIKFVNNDGFNHGHRGSDHTKIKLPFLSEVELDKEFSLYELILTNTNLKSHKFDKWYELYCGAKCKKINNKIIVNLDFDHGS